MRNAMLQKLYTTTNSNSTSSNTGKSTSASLDTSQLSAIVQVLRAQKSKAEASSFRELTKPVLFAKRTEDTPNFAVVFDDTADLRAKITSIGSALSQTEQKAGLFAESEATGFYEMDPDTLSKRLVNIDNINLSNIAAEDAVLIFEGIIALNGNNSFRKSNLPDQISKFIENNPHITSIMNSIMNIVKLYQGYYPDHAKDDVCVLLRESYDLLEKNNKITDLDAETKLVNQYILERQSKTKDPEASEIPAIAAAANKIILAANALKASLTQKLEAVTL